MNWFERHLNWTMVLAWLATLPAGFIVGFIGGYSAVSNDPNISIEALEGMGYILGFIVGLAILTPVFTWVMRRKNRSLWWVLLGLFVPFGGIVLLCLENRSEMRLK